jgi:hypothetical protein
MAVAQQGTAEPTPMKAEGPTADKDNRICGLVMPISPMAGYPPEHWKQVQDILSASIQDAGFEPNLVSAADEVGVIHKRIIGNLYNNPIAVCDVSGLNPNVMFELGLRLAFDKPTVIVKDEDTSYQFDTGIIEHLPYRSDLRYPDTVKFKEELATKIRGTYAAATANPATYTTFLKHFGEFKVAEIATKSVPVEDYVLEQLKEMNARLQRIETMRSEEQIPVLVRNGSKTRPGLVVNMLRELQTSRPANITPAGDYTTQMGSPRTLTEESKE